LDKETIMKRILSYACAVAMAVSGLSIAAPALALPASAMKTEVSSNLVDVQHRRGYYRRGPDVYYNGHRGSRERRPGWRRHNDAWFPPAAFIAGAIIGGALSRQASPPPPPVYRAAPPVRVSDAHIRWCYDRYRSYRASDNTFQPYNGPRRACRSPYR